MCLTKRQILRIFCDFCALFFNAGNQFSKTRVYKYVSTQLIIFFNIKYILIMKRQLPFIYVAFGVLAFGALFLNSDNGKSGNYCGLSTDSGTCSSCHGGGTVNGSGVTLSGAPASYVAGQTYPLTLTIKDPDAVSGGFQVVATNGVTTAQIGTFVAGTGSKLNDVKRPVQSAPKLFAAGSVSWTFNWTAPTTGTTAKFFYSVVAGNNDNNENVGDAVYSGSQAGPLSGVADFFTSVTKLKIYPNIVQKGGFITVETENNNADTQFQIVDLSGRILKTVKKAAYTEGSKISTSDLLTGSYFIRSTGSFIPQTNTFIVL
jgi:Secretion system C-terminal sorting domain